MATISLRISSDEEKLLQTYLVQIKYYHLDNRV